MLSLVGSDTCDRGAMVIGTEYHDGIRLINTAAARAILVRQPMNPYDKGAIAVYCGAWHVGFLSRERAASYRAAVDMAGGWLEVPCQVSDAPSGRTLHVSLPSQDVACLAVWHLLREDVRGPKPVTRHAVKLSQLSAHQDALAERLDETRGRLILAATPSGKYKGDWRLECVVSGEVIGVVPAQQRGSYPEVFDTVQAAGGKLRCEVIIREYPESFWAKAFVEI